MSQDKQKLIDLTKCVTMLSDLLCENVYVLQEENWEAHSTTLHSLLAYVVTFTTLPALFKQTY